MYVEILTIFIKYHIYLTLMLLQFNGTTPAVITFFSDMQVEKI